MIGGINAFPRVNSVVITVLRSLFLLSGLWSIWMFWIRMPSCRYSAQKQHEVLILCRSIRSAWPDESTGGKHTNMPGTLVRMDLARPQNDAVFDACEHADQ